MEEIELKIKMTSNAKIYNVKITKSDTILKLKEEVEKETQIPPESQNLVYKGRILVNEKLISDYNIENDHTIILVKKASQTKSEAKPNTATTTNTANTSTATSNTTNTNNTSSNTNNNANPFGGMGMGGQMPDLASLLGNIDPNEINDMMQNMGGLGGLGGMGDLGAMGVNPQMIGQILSNPLYMQMMNNMLQNPQMIQMALNSPQFRQIAQNNPNMQALLNNPELISTNDKSTNNANDV
jgi:ubiquilin